MHTDTIPAAARNASTQTYLPPTSLIICSRNRPKLLVETVESVLRGDEVPAELIIIDQSDLSHPTLAMLKTSRPCEIRYLWTRDVGVSRGRNIGIASARHDIVAIIDDDMIAAPHWFSSLIRALIHSGEQAVVTGRVLPTIAEVPDGFVLAVVVGKIPAVYKGRIGMDVLASGHMATYRSIIEAVGAFDEHLGPGTDFPAAEDNDLGFRLLEADYRIIYAPEAVLYHRAWRGRTEYLRMRWNYGRGKGGFYTKHLSLRDPYMLRRLLWDITQRVLFLPYRLWSQPRRACGDVIYSIGVFSGIIRWLMPQRQFRSVPPYSGD